MLKTLLWNCGNLLKKKDITADIDMSKLPYIVNKLTGKAEYPANCWNATKLFHGHLIVEYTRPEDMDEWLMSNTIADQFALCTYGTIMVFRRHNELIHTAVFVGVNKLWHKRGVSGKWEFITLKNICNEYPFCQHEYRVMKE